MSDQKEKYINPLTDFGFKKLFGTTHLSKLQNRPKKLQERVFTKSFEVVNL